MRSRSAVHSFRTVSRPDLIGAGVVMLIGAYLLFKSPEYGLQSGNVIGPGFVPFWFGMAMLIFGVSTAVGAFMKARRLAAAAGATTAEPDVVGRESDGDTADRLGSDDSEADRPHDESAEPDGDSAEPDDASAEPDDASAGPGGDSAKPARTVQAAIVFGISVAAVALTPMLGIAVAFGLAAVSMLWLVDRERWWLSIVVSAGVMTILYLLFAEFLKIPIPIGPWGF